MILFVQPQLDFHQCLYILYENFKEKTHFFFMLKKHVREVNIQLLFKYIELFYFDIISIASFEDDFKLFKRYLFDWLCATSVYF